MAKCKFWSLFSPNDYKTVYGDIKDVKTTGASAKTARQDNLRERDVAASHRMAKDDLERMTNYKDIIKNVAIEHKIDPALIAAIISRESRAGNTIKDTNGWGDFDPKRGEYNAFGLMQVDVNPNGGNHEPDGKWDSKTHLSQATGILVYFIKKIQEKFKGWSKEEQLKGGIAAYNIGDGKVESRDVDKNTTGGDYSNDVVARAQWYKETEEFKY
uniref:lysozyme g-like isoform X2 n=1 Tax=Semicossyphus pulcher TaxID=241346 RepID=UPI0037E93E16